MLTRAILVPSLFQRLQHGLTLQAQSLQSYGECGAHHHECLTGAAVLLGLPNLPPSFNRFFPLLFFMMTFDHHTTVRLYAYCIPHDVTPTI